MNIKRSELMISQLALVAVLTIQAHGLSAREPQPAQFHQPTKPLAIHLSTKQVKGTSLLSKQTQPSKREALRAVQSTAGSTPRYGLPDDFPSLFDQGDKGVGEDMKQTCVGGMENEETTRANIAKTPVVLIHGNLGSALHPKYGWKAFIQQLYDAGYTPAEVWAVSYLGYTDSTPDWLKYTNMAASYHANIGEVRLFIDAVKEYTGCPKVDIIGHSLGGGEARGYLYGLTTSDSIDPSLERFDAVSTFATIAAGNYGLGPMAFYGPFSAHWSDSHFNENPEPTPYGVREETQRVVDSDGQEYPESDWRDATDTDSGQIRYVAITSVGDAVDLLGSSESVSRLDGADLNYLYKSGLGPVDAHLEAIRAPEIIEVLVGDRTTPGGYLNKSPCIPAAAIRAPTGPVTDEPATVQPRSTIQFAF